MVNPRKRAGEPSPGRMVMVAAAVIGAGAFMGYGFVKMRESREAKVVAPTAEAASASAALVTEAQKARTALDTTALQRLEPELATAAPEAADARREQVAVLTVLALESSVRAAVSGDAKATEQASRYVARARPLVDQLEPELDPGFVLATRARLDLASGEDVLARHPAVLHPGFHDRELQHLLLAEPLWRPDPASPLEAPARTHLARALETTPAPTTFERLLLALAVPTDRAREVLGPTASHPLAQAMLTHLAAAPTVAVADPGQPDPGQPDPARPDPGQADPQPTEPAQADPEPTEPEPAQADPEPDDPAQADPQPADPDPGKKTNPTQPKQPKQPKAPSANPADEGCKLVHGGKAEQGFSLLQRAFDQNPRDTKVLLCMAEGHMKLGRLPSARALVERVVRSNGKNKKALQLAGKIEDQLGNERSAADYYRKLLEIEPDNATAKAYVEKHG